MTQLNTQRVAVDGIELITITRPSASKTVMLLHGFGASCDDLAPLAQFLDPELQWNWIFPNGILEVPLGSHLSGRAWFPIRMAEIEAAAMRGEVVDFSSVLPDGMKEAGVAVRRLMEHLHITPNQLVLGGFSQGAMMAVQVAVHLEQDLLGMILFSGTLINRIEWEKLLPDRSKVPFIQSHGRSDPILGFGYAKNLFDVLTRSGLKGEFLEFGGYHEIPLPVIQKTALFLQSLT